MDDLINGNVTSSGTTFFSGTVMLSTSLGYLNGNITNIQNNISQLSTGNATMTGYLNHASTAANNVQLIPNNALTSASPSISYTTAFDATYNAGNPTISSVVNTVVGSSANGGYVGTMYTIANSLSTTLASIASNSQTVASGIAGFGGSIGSIQSTLTSFGNQITTYNGNVNTLLSGTTTPASMGTMVIQIFYGVSLGLAVVSLVGVVLMTFCDKFKCRYLMYFACLFMFFIGLIGFLIAVIFSIIVPFLYWGCEWISTTTGSQTGFNSTFLLI
jgi:hypothetical protein